MRVISFVAIPLALAAAVACSSSNNGTGSGPTPTQIAKVSGDSQVAPAGTGLGTPFSVVVKDASGAPVAGVAVSWSAASGGGSVSAPSTATGVDGIASVTRTLGTGAGTQTTTASVNGLAGSPVTFTSVSHIQGATQIAVNGGNGQSDTVLATLATAISAVVKDEHNAPVAGVIVTWSVTGGGQVSQTTDTTDGSGITSVIRTFGAAAGTQSTVATVTGLVGSPVTVTSAATAGTAAQMALNGGNAQTGVKGTTLATTHSVNVRDASGNPKAGVTITWVVGNGGGSVSSLSPVTASDGVASVTRTLGDSTGTQTDTAFAIGLTGSPVVFTATATTAPMTASVMITNDQFTAANVTIAVGGTVTWTWNSGGITHNVTFEDSGTLGTGSGDKTSGTFQKTFSVAAGTYRYECTIHGVGFTSGMVGTVTVQ